MRTYTIALALCAAATTAGTVGAEVPRVTTSSPGGKLGEATAVYRELITAKDSAIPAQLLAHARCIAVLPGVIKAAIGFGARHGSGVISCRTDKGWSTPAFVNITGGSWGMQLGAERSDIVLFFMNDHAAQTLVKGSKITLGGQASIAAGPFGRSAEASTNLDLKAEIYSYAKAKGFFAGISLDGAQLSPDKDDNTGYYGSGVTYSQLLFGGGPDTVPAEAQAFRQVLP